MRTLVWSFVLVIVALILLVSPPAIHAQIQYELACPSGFAPLANIGKTFDALTGKWRANFCVQTNGGGHVVCQAGNCSGLGTATNGQLLWDNNGTVAGVGLWDGGFANALTFDPVRLVLGPQNGTRVLEANAPAGYLNGANLVEFDSTFQGAADTIATGATMLLTFGNRSAKAVTGPRGLKITAVNSSPFGTLDQPYAIEIDLSSASNMTNARGLRINASAGNRAIDTSGAVFMAGLSGSGTDICTDGTNEIKKCVHPTIPTQTEAITVCASGCTVTLTPCTTTASSFNSCDNTITWPTAFTGTAKGYSVTCEAIDPRVSHGGGQSFDGHFFVTSKSLTQIVYTFVNTIAEGDGVTAEEIDCVGQTTS